MHIRSRSNLALLTIIVIVGGLMATLSTTITSLPIAKAQGQGPPPIVHIGNPHDFRPGPPIPSCNANFHQGPPNDPIKGCKDTP